MIYFSLELNGFNDSRLRSYASLQEANETINNVNRRLQVVYLDDINNQDNLIAWASFVSTWTYEGKIVEISDESGMPRIVSRYNVTWSG